jgi:hypothetical protein
MRKMTTEPMEPASKDMQRFDDFIAIHEEGSHKHHKNDFQKHAAGHMFEQDKVAKLCGGGYMKGKK